MANMIKIEVVTPEKRVVDDQASEITIPGSTGYLGILPGHAPLITEIAVGEIAYKDSHGARQLLAVAWGFAEVLPDKVTVLAETAEKATDIDLERAQQARQRAEESIKSAAVGTDTSEAANALKRAESRIKVAKDEGK
jgi:F-type H+-transporting ATPase subunit epsilon